MSLSNADITRLLIAIVLLLVAAHGGGQLRVRLCQPRVAGEIIGGLPLGPTLFATVLPQWQEAIFSRGGATGPALGAFYQLGLFLLMFCSGAALRAGLRSGERRTAIVIASVGNVGPLRGRHSVPSCAEAWKPDRAGAQPHSLPAGVWLRHRRDQRARDRKKSWRTSASWAPPSPESC
jgi:hypothetical protein